MFKHYPGYLGLVVQTNGISTLRINKVGQQNRKEMSYVLDLLCGPEKRQDN